MMHVFELLYRLYRRFIKGRSQYQNARRYQLILNSLFCISLAACGISAAVATLDDQHDFSETIANIGLLAAVLIALWWLSRSGRHLLTTFAMLLCSSVALTNIMLARHFGIPSFEIGIVLLVTVIGTLLELRLTRAELAAERDLLEKRVIERTQLLEETQLRRTLELQRFAEFGRISAHLLHEVSNPLTVASLYLQQADERSSKAIRQARRSLQQLERYVTTARQQLRSESQQASFTVQRELRQLFTILKPVARHAGVQLLLEHSEPVVLHGDPVRFSQIMSNIITNAVDAYDQSIAANKRVTITVTQLDRFVQISVKDTGKGMNPEQITHIFEPFYTTKHGQTRGLGIGLAMVKQTVRDHFHGTICANSSPQTGTTFTLLLRLEQPEKTTLSDTSSQLTLAATA